MPTAGSNRTSGAGVTWLGIGASSDNTWTFSHWTAAEPGFLLKLGAWMRRSGDKNPTPQLAVYAGTSQIVAGKPMPGARLGFTASIGVAAGKGSAGASYEPSLVSSHMDASLGVSGAAVRLIPGNVYVLAIQNASQGLNLAGNTGLTAETFFRRTSSGDPPDPFTHSNLPSTTMRDVWAYWEPAVAPTVTITGPAASISTTAPVFTAATTDPDRVAPKHDRLAGYWIELRRTGETDLVWQSPKIIPASTERSSGNISRAYGGLTSLTTGSYQVRIKAVDDAGAEGDWTDWHTFVIANLPSVNTVASTPTGKKETGVVNEWIGQWVSPAGLSANAAKVRVLSGGEPIRGGDAAPWVTITPVAPNGSITLLDTSALITKGSAGPLPSGVYTWQMRGRDTSGSATEWSDEVPLSINFPPNTPASVRPISGTRITDPPLIDWLVSDPDPDDVLGSGLTSEWKITRLSTGAVQTGRTADVDPATGRGYKQFTSTQFPADGQYQVEIRGIDLSAEASGTGIGGWSAPITLEKVTSPSVAITSPTPGQTMLTGSPQIAFTVGGDGMLFYRVDLYDNGEPANPFFGSGFVPASNPNSGLYTVPAGVLANGQLYDVQVTTLGAGDIESRSPRVTFKIQFPQANIVTGLTADVNLMEADYEPVTVNLSWGPTGYIGDQFAGWIVTRRLATQPDRAAVVIAHIRSAMAQNFRDYHAPPNVSLVYGVSQLKRSGPDIQQSPVSEIEIDVSLTIPMIASLMPGRGADLRAPVVMLSDDLAEGFNREEATVPTWGTKGVPTLVRSPEGYGQRSYSVGFRLRTDQHGNVRDHIARWRNLVRSGHPVSLRTETEVVYCRIVPSPGWLQRSTRVGVYEVSVGLEEVAWTEAVKIKT